MIRSDKKNLISVFLSLLCAVALLFGIFGLGNKTSAQAFKYSQGGTLGTLYNYNGYFDADTLDAIAQAAGDYKDIKDLIDDVTENGTTIKGNKFQNGTLYFGKNGNTGEELEWTPAYVSTATVNGQKQAILTLWLSYATFSSTIDSQERSPWTDGTYSASSSTTKDYNGSLVYPSSYDGSYIRNYVLNGSTDYTKSWGRGTSITPPPASEMLKFTEFTSGDLAQYIVTPSDVDWQMAETGKNSGVAWSGYPNAWINDKLWLPSLEEIGNNLTNGIWNLSAAQCDSVFAIFLRTAYDTSKVYYITTNSINNGSVEYTSLVQPALHLNLNSAASYSVGGAINPSDVSVEYNGRVQSIDDVADDDKSWYDETRVTLSYFSDADCTASAILKDAGEYYIKVSLTDPSNSKFKNDEAATARGWKAVKFTVTKKPLSVTVSDADGDGVPEKVTGDSSALCEGDSMPAFGLLYGSAIGTGSASVPTIPGKYYATAVITDTTSNYLLDTSGGSHYKQFTVKEGVAKPYFANGAAGTVTAFEQYTGSALDFSLFGVTDKVKFTPLNAGIAFNKTDSKLTVTGGADTYSVKVELADSNAYQWDGGGSASFTLTVTITKGDYDFSNVKWQYKNSSGAWVDYPVGGLTYTGSNITLNVTGLPSGLSVLPNNYSGNVGKDANSYTAQVTALNGLDLTNFNDVTVSDIPQFTFNYTINKVQVRLDWSSSTQTIDGNSVIIPDLPSNAAYGVVYYAEDGFDADAGVPKAGAAALTLSDLTYDYTSSTDYYAYARLDSNVIYQNNYELVGTKFNKFSIGGGKTAVVVALNNSTKTYDGTPFVASATASFTDGSAAGIQLAYSYLASDGLTPVSAPTDAGTYYVKVDVAAINAGDFAISGTSVFEITIDKADYDLSGVQWKVGTDTYDLDGTISYVYDGTVRTLTIIGLSNVVGGLSVTLGGDYSQKNSGTYTVTLNITQDTVNYNPCGLPESYTWEITRLAIDLSGLAWNYDQSEPYVYERDVNGVVTHSVEPVLPSGLPQELVDVIKDSYGGVYSHTEKGTYRATASVLAALQGDANIQKNYNITYPSDFSAICDWKIEERVIAMPVYDGQWTVFDGDTNGHDLAVALGLPDDWRYYLDLDVNITLPDGTKSAYTGVDGDNSIGYDAGVYELVFTVKSGINVGADFNVWIDNDDTQSVEFTVAPKTVTVSGWKGSGTKAQAQFADSGVLSEWYTYVVYDDAGNVAVADANTGKYASGNYTRTVEPTSQNIEIKFADSEFVVFTVDDGGNEVAAERKPVARPVFIGGIEYTGNEVEITNSNVSEYFSGWDSVYMTVTSSDKGADAGNYVVTVTLKNTAFSVWEDEEGDSIDIEWSIAKAKISGEWGDNGILTLSVDGMDSLPEGLIVYEYMDEDGNAVEPESRTAGVNYTVKASLNYEFENNFEFDESLTELIAEPYEFTQTEEKQEGTGGNGGIDWMLVFCIGCLLFDVIIFIITMRVLSRNRKEAAEAEEDEEDGDGDNYEEY